MGAQANGRAKKPKKSAQVGSINGHVNGYASKYMSGHAEKPQVSTSVPRPRQKKAARTWPGTLTSVLTRLTTWYLVTTILFRCPSSLIEVDETSSRVCKPYLQGRDYITPYLEPYYHTYVTPLLENIKPYVDSFDTQVYGPAAAFTKDKYATYGAHRVEHAKKYAEAQYEQTVRPHLHVAQEKAKEQYSLYLEPHVQKASNAAAPYYDQTKASLEEIYHLSVLPTYQASLPYLQQFHVHGHHFLIHIFYPYTSYVRDASWIFMTRTVWPQIRVLYGDNVEPQLVRISERLGRYHDQQKLESAVDAMDAPEADLSGSGKLKRTSASSSASVTKSKRGILDDFFGAKSASARSSDAQSDSTTAPQSDEPLDEAELRERLNQDLRKWQSKFAVAADKGTEDLEQRITEITNRQVKNAVKGHGKALVTKLEENAHSAVTSLKTFVKKMVKTTPDDITEEQLELTYEEVGNKAREYGLVIKEKANDVRAWRAAYEQETESLIQAAITSTKEVLEKIHGLGLQEVGMRWAWTDGVTYKDWQNYHKLRENLDGWQRQVEAVAWNHEGHNTAQKEAKRLEDNAIDAASNMVAELVRLRNVSKWKLWAGDATDDFTDKKVPARVFKAAQQVKQDVQDATSQVSDAIQGSSKPFIGSVASSVKSALSKASYQASEVIQENAAKASAAYVSPKRVFGGANAQILDDVKQVILDEPFIDDDYAESWSDNMAGMIAEAGERASDLSRIISEGLLGQPKTKGAAESVSSLASEQYAKAMAAASSIIYGTTQPAVGSATSVASEKFAQAVTAASYAIYGTPAPTAIIKTIQYQALARYKDAMHLADEQLEAAKSQFSQIVSGKPKPAHVTMLSYFDKVYSDSLAVASERLSAALKLTESVRNHAAGLTQGYFESVSSIASSRLAEGISQASARFSPAEPTGVADTARRQYYEAIGLAHARYSEFVDAASSAINGPQQGTVASLASEASASAASAALAFSGSAKSAAANAHAAVQSMASSASSAVIGTETPWTQSAASQASQNWEALITQASSQIYGKPTTWIESAYSQAGAYGAQATAAAAAQYADLQALMSELVLGKEPAFTESVMNRFASAYQTGIPAAMASVQSFANEKYDTATSYAGDGYEAVTDAAADAYASAASVVGSAFSPPPAIEDYLAQASASLDQALASASIALYGTPKGAGAKASESVVSAYASMQSRISVQVYGSQQALDSFTMAAADAQLKISAAIFGTPTAANYVASATSGAAGAYMAASSAASVNAKYVTLVASANAAAAGSAISSAIYGPQQGALESANSRIAAAVAEANSKIAEMYAGASKGVEGAASSAASAVAEATQKIKDEL